MPEVVPGASTHVSLDDMSLCPGIWMDRRKLLGALAGIPALPLAARAQEPSRNYRLGMQPERS